ncbi:MAG: hypothetical protein ACFFDN_47250, partial [Candidatus Hodarchaeota archaeon]
SKFLLNKQLNPKFLILLTQINRLLPINLRKISRITTIHNSKAMALFLSSFLNLDQHLFSKHIDYTLQWLLSSKSRDYKQYTIGFSHDIVLRGYTSKRGQSSLIITLFALYAFIAYYINTNNKKILSYILSFNDLINRQLPKFETKKTLWYSYNFNKINEIYNATAKIGKYFALIYSITKETILLNHIDKILTYLLIKQRPDGSWAYGEKISYTDGFHTAFVLEAMYEMLKYLPTKKYIQMYEHGLSHYKNHLFKKNGQPLYFHKSYPPKDIRRFLIETDIRDCAMAIILFSKTGQIYHAKKVLNWTFDNMYNKFTGHFYYYKNPLWTATIEYIRWQAWMLYALSVLLKSNN